MRIITAVLVIAACIAAASATARAATDEEDPVLAIVGDVKIHQSDVDRLYEQAGQTPDMIPLESAINELIRRESIRQYVLNSDFNFDQPEIDESWQQWLDLLSQHQMTLAQYAEATKMSEAEIKEVHIIDQKLRQLLMSTVTDEERKQLEVTVRASHILLKLAEDAPEDKVKEATAKIEFIRQEIIDGESFEDAAKAYSEGPSAPRGGDLGYFPRYGGMVEPFAAAAYALEKGAVSEPVRTQFGLHLIEVTDRRKATEDEQAQANGMLLNVKYAELVEKIKADTKVERLYKQDEEDTTETASSPKDAE